MIGKQNVVMLWLCSLNINTLPPGERIFNCILARYQIMEQCWSEDSNKRPEFSELVLQLEKVAAARAQNEGNPHYINMKNGTTQQNGHAVQPQ